MRAVVGLIIVCIASAVFSAGQTFTTLANFDGSNGSGPAGPLVQASDGNFYGVTTYGGSRNAGVAFKVTPEGVLTVLHVFCTQNTCPDGLFPQGALLQAHDGNLYGTTFGTGAIGLYGTVYRMTREGDLTTVHTFNGTDGASPASGLLQVKDGTFYGTTTGGGPAGYGTVFGMTSAGALTTLHGFGFSEGNEPYAGLVQADDGNFYGTTSTGGPVLGTVFKITPGGILTTIHSFGGNDGSQPSAGMVQGKDGNLYGTTYYGGPYGSGTIFKITLQGSLTTLHTFCSQPNDCPEGERPADSLIQATDGNFYGTTSQGGQYGWGTVFKMTPDGTMTTLHDFNRNDGGAPSSGLVQVTDGSFYGTTSEGGSSDQGTIFHLIVYPTLAVVKSGMGTVSSVDGHINCGGACSWWYYDGQQVTLSAVPAPGYTFSGWTNCDNVNGSYCSITMAGARNATASFTSAGDITLASLTFKPSYVKGGQLSAGTLTLSGPAPSGGLSVALSSDHPGVAHPPSFVFVPGGQSSVQFAVQSLPVKSNTTVTITAAAGASQVGGTLMVGTASLPPALK